MKTIRLLYPDHASGGLDTYWFGARLLQHLLPPNDAQPVLRVEVAPPDGREKAVTRGITARDEVMAGIASAKAILASERPGRVVTLGGNCLVSLAPFDYLRGLYGNVGVIWVDAHPDVSLPEDGYPYAHAMVLSALMGRGDDELVGAVVNGSVQPGELLYVGLQGLHDYQREFLDAAGVGYRVQTEAFLDDQEVAAFAGRFDHVLVHLDIDVLDERLFHSTYFANAELVGDGATGGRMTMGRLAQVLATVEAASDVVGLTIAEYLPFEAERLSKLFCGLAILNG